MDCLLGGVSLLLVMMRSWSSLGEDEGQGQCCGCFLGSLTTLMGALAGGKDGSGGDGDDC